MERVVTGHSRAALLIVFLAGALSAAGARSDSSSLAPLPTVDPGGAPNIFYGGSNPNASGRSPVLVFVHGLGTNATYWFIGQNTMYQNVYDSGYRSAYVSLSPDNSNNHNPIAQNAQVLQALLPQILRRFQTQQVYLVCHSKGGLDAQQAMMDPIFRSAIKSVFLLATPNQGTALADWAFGKGQKIANLFGFVTPGLYDLRPEHVAELRAQFDPVFATAGIPFYYLEGGSYSGQRALFYSITGPILKNLTNGTNNDGLVSVPEVALPDSYAEDLGSVNVDHTKVGFGDSSWNYVYGRVAGLENRLSSWQKVASGGFGDDQNTWNWSQTWFKGSLYVGTGRNVNCIITDTATVQTGIALYPSVGCPTDPLQIATPAEIWRYTPQTKTWTRVHKSPQDVPLGIGLDGNPAFAARSLGFRGMGVFTESDGTQALYVGGVSAISIYNKLPQYANSTYPPPVILRSTDGTNFAELPHDPGTFLGEIVKNNSDIFVSSFRSIVQANGQMFVAVTDFRGEGFIMAAKEPSLGNNAFVRVSSAPAVPNFACWVLANYNNALYVGTGDRKGDEGYGVFKTTNQWGDPVPYTFTPIIQQGGWQTDINLRSPTALTMHVWTQPDDGQQHLWVGTDRKIEIVRVNPDDSWDLIMGQPRNTPGGLKAPLSGIGYYFDNDFNGHIWQLQDSPNKGIHAGTWDWSVELRPFAALSSPVTSEQGFDFFQSPDGVHWYVTSKNGLGDGENMGGRSGNFNHFGLFWGTARDIGGSQVWQDNSILDLNGDGKVSQADANMIVSALGQSVTGFDARDVNGNGVIDATDIQYLESQCTFPNCSEVPPPGIAYTPPAAPFQGFLEASTQAAVGNTVVISWPHQTGAARYHVYRYTTTPALPLILQGAPSQTVTLSSSFSFNIPGDFYSGKLGSLCSSDQTDLWFCQMADAFAQSNLRPAPNQLTTVGYPAAVEEIAQTTQLSYAEPMPTTLQSLYFVKAEDANGILTEASNIVGAPSFAQVPIQ